MRLLVVSPWAPYPPDSREMVRSYHQVLFLSKRHDVDLICFTPAGTDDSDARNHLRGLCPRVEMLPIATQPQSPDSLLNLVSSRPLAQKRFYRKDMLRRLRELGEAGRHDLVWIDSAGMAPYLSAFPETRRVVDLVDVGSRRWAEYAALADFPARKVYAAEADRLRLVETEAAAAAQQVVLASETEAEAFRTEVSDPDRVASLKTPVIPTSPGNRERSERPTLLLLGHLDHFPNADAARCYLQDVHPAVQASRSDLRLVIAGKNPPDDLRSLADTEGVELTEEREELLRQAWLIIAPHRIAGGVRNEILEAMAQGLPVLATPEAAAGLDVDPGTDLLVAPRGDRFAAAVASALADPEALETLGQRGRDAVKASYSHWGIMKHQQEILQRAADAPFVAPE